MSLPPTLTIVLGSVLKPVTDVRLYQKIGLALAQKPTHQLHIIGNAPAKLPDNIPQNIQLYPVAKFHRTSYQRLFYQFVFWTYLQKIQPQIIIVNTIELLPTIVLYKFFTKNKVKLVYDIMENYYQNIAFQATYSVYYRKLLAWAVKYIEAFCCRWIDQFLIAEKCFLVELAYLLPQQTIDNKGFKSKKYLLVENKYQISDKHKNITFAINKHNHNKVKDKEQLHFIYTGTISQAYGLLSAIELLKKINSIKKNITFTIIGYCTDNSYYQTIQTAIKDVSFIKDLISTDQPVAHTDIIAAMQEADFAVLPYQANISTQNRIPTKFYEYIYYKIPMLIPTNKVWEAFCLPYDCAIGIDFQKISGEELLKTLYATNFYTKPLNPALICWTEEESVALGEFLLEGL